MIRPTSDPLPGGNGQAPTPRARAEADLVRAAQRGDREAFAELVKRYQNAIAAVAYALTGRLSLSEDVAQETFIVTWRRLREIREPDRFRSWLLGVTRRTSQRALRNHRVRFEETGLSFWASELPSQEPSPLDRAIDREEEHLLWEALRKIPASYRLPLVLFYREQRSVEKVAEMLELSPKNVSVRLARGRRMLHQHIADLLETMLTRRIGGAFTAAVMLGVSSLAAGGANAAPSGSRWPEGARPFIVNVAALVAVVAGLGGAVRLAATYRDGGAGTGAARRAVATGDRAGDRAQAVPRLAPAAGPAVPEERTGRASRILYSVESPSGSRALPVIYGRLAECPPGIEAAACVLGTADFGRLASKWPWHMGYWRDNPHLGHPPGLFISFDYWLRDDDSTLDVQLGMTIQGVENDCCWNFVVRDPAHRAWGHLQVPISAFVKTVGRQVIPLDDYDEVYDFDINQVGKGTGGFYVANVQFGIAPAPGTTDSP